ncbi:MAG: helix-turn-helix transcriptional regulator [Erysipelotrichaceae bacterium]|nr:helix-turn-helix transcriptional regulator [Erysipelotrichaceae bacterium]
MRSRKDLPKCPVATTISLVGNKWKLLIIRNLMGRPWRFNELLRSLNGISQKVLTDNLSVYVNLKLIHLTEKNQSKSDQFFSTLILRHTS